MSGWSTNRAEPYTDKGIRRLMCIRGCGNRASAQWNICADGPYRPICVECDIELNKLVLEWVRHPKAAELGEKYAGAARAKKAWGERCARKKRPQP